MKTSKITYWITTAIIFLFDAVIPALTSHTQVAIEGIRHLGFPDYFRVQLTIFKVIGGLLLILPQVPAKYKEWAYVGFGINFISAAIGHTVVDGFGIQTILPLVILGLLVTSYIHYHKLRDAGSFAIA